MVRFRRGKNSINIVLNRKTLTTYNHSSYPIRTQDVFCKDELRNSRNFPLLLGSHTLQSSAWVFFHSIRLRAGSSHCNLIHQRYHDCLLRYGIIQSKHISYWGNGQNVSKLPFYPWDLVIWLIKHKLFCFHVIFLILFRLPLLRGHRKSLSETKLLKQIRRKRWIKQLLQTNFVHDFLASGQTWQRHASPTNAAFIWNF